MKSVVLLAASIAVTGTLAAQRPSRDGWSRMRSITPKGYVCYQASTPMLIDGKGDEEAWQLAPWTDDFVDIVGRRKPKPRFRTRAKMLWDDQFFYVLADMEEPHVWATLTQKNSAMYNDNDFEVFIDPDGDNHNYYEFEMNAFNTIWELTLPKPYMDGGRPRQGTNLDGLQSAVHVRGTVNDPTDTDSGWSVEIAFPWDGLKGYAGTTSCPPSAGHQWRIGYSRVNWLVDIIDRKYRKVPRRAHREDNWVWSPQGVVNMHRPERWGYVQFEDKPGEQVSFKPDPTLRARELLMSCYHAQRSYKRKHRRYAADLESLGVKTPSDPNLDGPKLEVTSSGFVATVQVRLPDGSSKTLCTRQDSRLWVEVAEKS